MALVLVVHQDFQGLPDLKAKLEHLEDRVSLALKDLEEQLERLGSLDHRV